MHIIAHISFDYQQVLTETTDLNNSLPTLDDDGIISEAPVENSHNKLI
jgi:hypothetical protein